MGHLYLPMWEFDDYYPWDTGRIEHNSESEYSDLLCFPHDIDEEIEYMTHGSPAQNYIPHLHRPPSCQNNFSRKKNFPNFD